MKLKDIVFLVVAIIAWLYSSYRSFQKQAAKKTKPVSENPPLPPLQSQPQPTRIPSIKSVPAKREIREKVKPALASTKWSKASVSQEKLTSDIQPIDSTYSKQMQKKEGYDVNKIKEEDYQSSDKNIVNTDLMEEIHSGKTDWRKAIILNELIRPVYF